MKKILLLLAASSLVLSLCSCGNNIPEEPSVATNIGTSMFNQIMETEDGYYYNEAMAFNELSLRFYDKATGKDLFLCAKPECTHDGNSFCAATAGGLNTCYTAMYGDSIYIAAIDRSEERREYKLLKASLDGTELTEICTFMNVNETESSVMHLNDESSMVIHNGYAFVPYSISTSDEAAFQAGRTGAAVINLKNGKYKLITEYDLNLSRGPWDITADGDYFYYNVFYYENTSKNEFWRYNFKTGEEEKLALKESISDYIGANFAEGLWNYAVIDGKIWYIRTDPLRQEMFVYNPDDNSTVKMEQFDEKLMNTEVTVMSDGEVRTHISTYADPRIRYDGEYLYIAEHGFYGSMYNEWDMKLHIFNPDGEELGGFVYEREGACQINILNKIVYLQSAEGVKYCSVEDIINGNTEWKALYEFTDHVINEINW